MNLQTFFFVINFLGNIPQRYSKNFFCKRNSTLVGMLKVG
ncbi:hypothetical protein HMPREF1869_01644 [Bacteroidales bacterium KA00251]|nr:hypothetical protein HMPREF1869_01644 [Bacteroidales bacterium KA00251]